MSQIRLKCDRCGEFFRDSSIDFKCGYCKKKEKQELIEKFLEVDVKPLLDHVMTVNLRMEIESIIEKWEAKK